MSVSVATISSIRRLSRRRRSNRGALIAACGVICLGRAMTAGPLVACNPAVAVLLLGLAGRRRPRRSSVEADIRPGSSVIRLVSQDPGYVLAVLGSILLELLCRVSVGRGNGTTASGLRVTCQLTTELGRGRPAGRKAPRCARSWPAHPRRSVAPRRLARGRHHQRRGRSTVAPPRGKLPAELVSA